MFLRSFQHILELVNLLSVNNNDVVKTWHQNHKRTYHLATWTMLPLELRKILDRTKNVTLEKFPQWKITEIVATRCQILRLQCTKFACYIQLITLSF